MLLLRTVLEDFMNQDYMKKVVLLRQRIPVGMRHGLALLNQTSGDVEQATTAFKQEMVALVMRKTGVTEATAALHLQQVTFDIALALKRIEEIQFSLTERIVKRYQNKREAIRMVAYTVAENRQLTRSYWLSFEELQQLPPVLGCVLMLNEWLSYANWEGWDSAVYFNLDVIIDLLDEPLQLPQLGIALQRLRSAELAQASARQAALRTKGSFAPEAAFNRIEQEVAQLEPLLIDVVYAFILSNIKLFP